MLENLKTKKVNSVLFKYKQIEYQNEERKFSTEITRTFKDPLTRQANESVRIYNRGENELLNIKSEFNNHFTVFLKSKYIIA